MCVEIEWRDILHSISTPRVLKQVSSYLKHNLETRQQDFEDLIMETSK